MTTHSPHSVNRWSGFVIAPALRILVLALATMFACPGYAEDTIDYAAAGAVVDELHENLLDVMKNADALGYEGRFRQLDPLVAKRFDTPLIVKVILSRYWSDMSEQQQQDFVQLFHRLSVATYASRFDAYDGEKFVEVGHEALKAGRVLIKTELRTNADNDQPVKLDYLMHQADDGEWMIISVIANGVNDLSLKRAEYAAVLKERGYDGLVADLNKKIATMAADGGA